jgi:beta-N-acetylhexosaminidase
MVDQEGGKVRRLPGAPVLSEKQIGETSDPIPLSQWAGTQAGRNLRAAGINVNLAPVLDVFRQPGNFIDADGRSYSNNPTIVGELGASFIYAQQHQSVAATAKHFPGLGEAATDQNTDAGPVTLNLPLSELRQVDELPYHDAMLAGVKLVMTSWAIYPALDPRLPAGLSPIVIGRELRRRLGFRGVVVTDTIGAGALSPYGSIGERAVLASRAGADLIIASGTNSATNTPATGIAALSALREALADGSLRLTTAEQEAGAVIALRRHP